MPTATPHKVRAVRRRRRKIFRRAMLNKDIVYKEHKNRIHHGSQNVTIAAQWTL